MRLRFRSVVSREYSEWTAVEGTGRRSVEESRSGDAVETRGDRVKELRKSCTLNAVDAAIEVDARTEVVVVAASDAGCTECWAKDIRLVGVYVAPLKQQAMK